jgi:hypothetical protein
MQPKSIVQKLGEVQLYFRVRRLKSDLLEETYSEETVSPIVQLTELFKLYLVQLIEIKLLHVVNL